LTTILWSIPKRRPDRSLGRQFPVLVME